MRTTLQKQRCRLPLWLLACLMIFCSMQARATGDTWTYDASASTLTNGSVTLKNVTANDKKLTIGNNRDLSNITTLDLTGTINDSYAITAIGGYSFQNIGLTSITIPATVTEIGRAAFSGCKSLETVTFVDSPALTTITDGAFESCEKLKSITIPASVTTLGKTAFYKCSALETVTFATGTQLTKIEQQTFNYCTSLKSITIPASIKEIGINTFQGCTSLATVTFAEGSGLETIGNFCFGQCKIAEITIPATVTKIVDAAFQSCSNLAKVIYNGTTQPEIGNLVFYGDAAGLNIYLPNGDEDDSSWDYTKWGVASIDNLIFPDWKYDTTKKKLVKGSKELTVTLANTTELTIGENTTSLKRLVLSETIASTDENNQTTYTIVKFGDNAFTRTGLTSIKIPSTVKEIGANALYCQTLGTVTFAENSTLETVGSTAFAYSKIETLEIPASVKTIGQQAFMKVPLTMIDLSKNTNLTEILPNVFKDCTKLESVKLPASITKITTGAFSNCSSLDTISFEGTKQPATIDNDAFTSSSTRKLYLPKGDKDDDKAGWNYTAWGLASADNMIFPDWEYDATNTKLVKGSKELIVTASNKELTITASNSYAGKTLILPNEIKKVGDESGTDIYKVVGINAEVFKSNTTLEAVVLPNTLTTLGASAFEGCTALKEATIPATVTTFADKIFYGCTSLLDITYMGKTQPSSFGTDAFKVSDNTTVTDRYVTLPKGKKTDTNWTPASWAIADADHFVFGGWAYNKTANTVTVGEDNEQIVLNVTLANTKELTVIGVKTLPAGAELDLTGSIANIDENDDTEYIIVGIASNAFQGKALPKVTLPETLATIGTGAFKDATITELHLSYKDTTSLTVGTDAFALKDKNTCIVRVPDGKLASFHTDKPYSNWQDFTYVLEEKGTLVDIFYKDEDDNGWPYYDNQLAKGSFLAKQAPVGQTFRFFLKHAHADSTFVITAKLGSTKKEGDDFFYKKDTVTLKTPAGTDAWTLIVTSIGPIVENSGDKITIKTEEDYTVGENEKSFNGTIKDTKAQELEIGASSGGGDPTEINIKMENVTVATTSPDATAKTTVTSNTEATITLSGTNTLGELENAGTLILTTTDPDLKLTTTKVTNSGTLVDSTGIITKVEGDASIDLTPLADQKVNANASAKLTTTATFATGATTIYTWDKYNAEKKEWEQVKTNATQPLSFKSLRSDADQANELTVDADDAGQYRCMVTTTKESVSTTLTTFATVTKVTSTPPTPPVYVYYTVTLPKVEGATTTPKAGKHTVEEGDSFSFKLELDPEYDQSVPVVKVGETEITPNAAGKYVIRDVEEDLTVSITGIVKNGSVGIEEIAGNETKVWGTNGVLHIYTPQPATVYVLSFTGSIRKALGSVTGNHDVTLAKGAYIVVIGEKRFKVIL